MLAANVGRTRVVCVRAGAGSAANGLVGLCVLPDRRSGADPAVRPTFATQLNP